MFMKRSFFTVTVMIFICSLITFQLNAQTNHKVTNSGKSESKNETETKSSDPWTAEQVITTKKLDELLSAEKEKKPLVLMIGFDFLYSQGHIPGSVFAGAASNKNGIKNLQKIVTHYKKDESIVIYCGCCPFDHCPNVRPAFKTLEKMGYKNLKVLYLPNDFEQNWKDRGYTVSTK